MLVEIMGNDSGGFSILCCEAPTSRLLAISTMEATAQIARTPPFARHEGARSGSSSDEDDKVLRHSSTLATLHLLTRDSRSVTLTQSPIASMKWKARLQMASLCWTMFHLAWNREPIGPLMFKLVMAPGGVVMPNRCYVKLGTTCSV